MLNLISLKLTDEQLADIKKKVTDLKTALKPVLEANIGEGKKRQFMGQGSKGFVDDCRDTALQFPEILPGTFSIDEMETDLAYVGQIASVSSELLSLTKQVLKTEQTAGQDLMDASNTIYNLIKNEAKRDKAKYGGVETRLKQRYQQQRKEKEKPVQIIGG